MGWHNSNFNLQHEVQGPLQITMSPHSDLGPDHAVQRPLFQSLQLIPFNHGPNPSAYNYYHGLNSVATSDPGNIAPSSTVRGFIEGDQEDEGQIRNQNQDSTSTSSRTNHPPLLCDWPGCKRPGPFSNKGTRRRHFNTQHLAPRSYKCPHRGCTRSFNRKDNLDQHLRFNAHWK